MDRLLQSQYSAVGGTASLAAIEKKVIQQVFFWMTLGLLTTAGAAWWVLESAEMKELIFGNKLVFFGLIIAELGLVFAIGGLINRLSSMAATGLFFLYSALNGLTLSAIFMVYSLGSIVGVFFITAGMFGVMAAFGATTNRDLSKMGSLLFMALIGMIIAGLVNMFLGSSLMSFIISAVGVVVFTGLTAYDMQRIKLMANGALDGESEGKIAVLGALSLYLNFINLFLSLLRLFGGRSDD